MENLFAQNSINTNQLSPLFPILTGTNVYATVPSVKSRSQSRGEVFLEKVRAIIHEKIDEPEFGIKDLCEAMHLSYMQVFRKMKTYTGENPTNFIRKVRLEKAKELLRTTDLNIAEIAYDLGFADPNYFSRAFSKEFEVSPRVMRKNYDECTAMTQQTYFS